MVYLWWLFYGLMVYLTHADSPCTWLTWYDWTPSDCNRENMQSRHRLCLTELQAVLLPSEEIQSRHRLYVGYNSSTGCDGPAIQIRLCQLKNVTTQVPEHGVTNQTKEEGKFQIIYLNRVVVSLCNICLPSLCNF